MSYVLRPSTIANGVPVASAMYSSITSSQKLTDHPPSAKPFSASSSGPPGACMTPSRLRNVLTISSRIVAPSDVRALPLGRLEDLDRVAGGILDEDLLASGAGHDVVAEAEPGGAEPFDLRRDVLHHELDPVPAARL